MKKEAVKDLLYGGIMELVNNRSYYYNSGISDNYNHFTPEGQEAVTSYLRQMAIIMLHVEEESLDKRAKDMVLKELKT